MRKVFLLMMLCFLISGCIVRSINSFYTDSYEVTIPELMGVWKSEIQLGDSTKGKDIDPWTFSKNTIDSYDLDNTPSELYATYFKIEGIYFMDVGPGRRPEGFKELINAYWHVGVMPVHFLFKLEIKDNKLRLIPFNPDWFTDRIEDGTVLKLPFVRVESGRHIENFICTATSEEWIAFLKKHKDNEEVFWPEANFVFRKVE